MGKGADVMFTHLHVHSENSLFDGMAKVEEILQWCKQLGMHSIAITDHHNVYAWFQLHKLAKKYGIKPLFGIELNVGKHHLTAIALSNEGLANLCRLNNLGYQGKSARKITEEDIFCYQEGVYFLSGCMKGKIPSLLQEGKEEEAYAAATHYHTIFHKRFAIEIQSYQFKNKPDVTKKLIRLAKHCGIDIVPSNDCHFIHQKDAINHKQLVSMHSNGKIQLKNNENYMKSTEEMQKFYPELVIANTEKISRLVNTDFDAFIHTLKGDHTLPISMMYYYDDASSLKAALFDRKKYALGNYMYKKMVKGKLTLEQVEITEEIKESIDYAFSLRNKLYQIEPDPYYAIHVSELFPRWRKTKEATTCGQLDYFTAVELGLLIQDNRREKNEPELLRSLRFREKVGIKQKSDHRNPAVFF